MKNKRKSLQIKERYSPNLNVGLLDSQVNTRITEGALNAVVKKYSKSYLSIFLDNICTLFNLYGLIVFIALIIAKAEITNMFFVIIYLINIFIGIFQEIRSKRTIDKLSLVSRKKSKVLRDGKIIEIDPTNICLDDIIILSLGDQIPTDSILVDGDAEINESLLTGESIPIKKKIGEMVYAGSFVVNGNCKIKAEKVGEENYISTLSAKAKQYKRPHSELMNALKSTINILGFLIVPITIVTVVITSVSDTATTMSAKIVSTCSMVIGMIPAGMMLLTSVALAVGVIKLAYQKTLVQDLYSLEMLARVDTICFDKTGTITDGNMTVKKVIALSKSNTKVDDIISSILYSLHDENQTANALKNYFGEKKILNSIYNLHFSSSRKLSAVSFDNGYTYSIGAPEFVLDKEKYSKLSQQINSYAQNGLRILVVAKSNKILKDNFIPTDFSPIALIILADNIRKEAYETVKWFNQNDVSIKVISGDNPLTVAEVSKRVGIINADKFISLEEKTDEEIIKLANQYTVFGRVTPEQKALLVKSIKNDGHTTAMTGDGINDILALKEADCAISVAEGSDAARSVSHLVLMNNNFNSMPKVVYEGRRVVNNIQASATLYLMKTLFTMMTIIFCWFFTKGIYPINLKQLFVLEVFIIAIPSFCLSFQPNDERIKGKFISQVILKTIPSSILMFVNVITIMIITKICNYTNYNFSSSFCTHVITLAGTINLVYLCLPLNKFRSWLLFPTLFVLILITVVTLIFGFTIPIINNTLLYKVPFNEYLPYYIALFSLIIFDIPFSFGIRKLCAYINNKFLINKKLL